MAETLQKRWHSLLCILHEREGVPFHTFGDTTPDVLGYYVDLIREHKHPGHGRLRELATAWLVDICLCEQDWCQKNGSPAGVALIEEFFRVMEHRV